MNPFADITDPAILRAMVQDGVKCEACKGRQWPQVGPDACPVCCGPGKIPGKVPLPNPDLDALAACWCEGEWVTQIGTQWQRYCPEAHTFGWLLNTYRCYTTSPEAAMRLQEKYKISTMPVQEKKSDHWWADAPEERGDHRLATTLCHAITTAALVAALTEAINE